MTQLLGDPGAIQLTYTYNPAGQLNRLKRVKGTVTTTQTRTYDASGMLAAVANVTGSATTLDWDPTSGVAHLLGMTVAGTTDIVQGVAGLVGSKTGATSAAYGLDQNGSVITGAQARSTGYSAFGDPTTASTFEPRLGYRGELTVDTLTYLRARDYQAVTGGFTSADPILGRAGTTTLNNRYHYVDNKPLQRVDPTGLYSARDSTTDVRPGSPPLWSLVGATPRVTQVASAASRFASLATPVGEASAGGVAAAVVVPLAIDYVFYDQTHEQIESDCANGGTWCPTNALPPPAKGLFEWAAKQTLDWSFLDDDPPSAKPQPAAAGSRGGPPTTTASRCVPLAGGGASLENLSDSDAARIQNAANKIGMPITVVGSRAGGTSQAWSDWDYVITGANSSIKGKVRNSLPEGHRGIGAPRNIDIFTGPVDTDRPHITFNPC